MSDDDLAERVARLGRRALELEKQLDEGSIDSDTARREGLVLVEVGRSFIPHVKASGDAALEAELRQALIRAHRAARLKIV